jgi:drug/metabolite transporter (DMT)-like permease
MKLKKLPSFLSLTSILLVAPFFLWGTAMVAMKGTISHSTPLFMAALRLIPAGVLVLIAAMVLKRPQPQGWLAWLWIGLFAVVDGTLFQGLLANGLVRTTAGLGSVMIDSQPLAVALLSAWLFREQIGMVGGFGLILGIVGIGAIGLPTEWLQQLASGVSVSNFDLQALFAHGEWLMLLAALSMAVGTVLIPFVTKYVDPIVATGWHMILGGIPLAIGSVVLESHQWTDIDAGGWLALSYSTVFGSAIAYGLFFYFASAGNLTSLSSLTFLTPVFALLFGNLFLSETLNSIQSMGVGLTLVSIWLINQREFIAAKLTNRIAKQKPVELLQASSQPEVVEVSTEVELDSISIMIRELDRIFPTSFRQK